MRGDIGTVGMRHEQTGAARGASSHGQAPRPAGAAVQVVAGQSRGCEYEEVPWGEGVSPAPRVVASVRREEAVAPR